MPDCLYAGFEQSNGAGWQAVFFVSPEKAQTDMDVVLDMLNELRAQAHSSLLELDEQWDQSQQVRWEGVLREFCENKIATGGHDRGSEASKGPIGERMQASGHTGERQANRHLEDN